LFRDGPPWGQALDLKLVGAAQQCSKLLTPSALATGVFEFLAKILLKSRNPEAWAFVVISKDIF
jgi:hypothetical protein